MALKKNVIIIKEDVEIAPRVYLSKGDTLVETSKGRWTIFEADDDEEDKKDDDKVEESDDEDEDDKVEKAEDEDEDEDEDDKEESAADKKKMAKVRAAKK